MAVSTKYIPAIPDETIISENEKALFYLPGVSAEVAELAVLAYRMGVNKGEREATTRIRNAMESASKF